MTGSILHQDWRFETEVRIKWTEKWHIATKYEQFQYNDKPKENKFIYICLLFFFLSFQSGEDPGDEVGQMCGKME